MPAAVLLAVVFAAPLATALAIPLATALAIPVATALATPVAPPSPVPVAPAWRLPVRGELVRAFSYDERRPFAAGSRRGVDIAPVPGAAVRSACSGRVTHAGRVPERGLGVSVRCGRLTATHLGLAALTVRRGARVRRGQQLGRTGPSGVVRLGARITTRRFGWIDPLALVGAPPPPVGPPPLVRAPRAPVPRTPAPRAPLRPPVPRPAPPRLVPDRLGRTPARRPSLPLRTPAPAHRDVPALAWLGAALFAGGLPLGAVVTLRRSRSGRRHAVGSRVRS